MRAIIMIIVTAFSYLGAMLSSASSLFSFIKEPLLLLGTMERMTAAAIRIKSIMMVVLLCLVFTSVNRPYR